MALLHSSMFRAGKVYLVPYFSSSTFSIALLHAPHRVCSRWASGTDCYQQYVCDFKSMVDADCAEQTLVNF